MSQRIYPAKSVFAMLTGIGVVLALASGWPVGAAVICAVFALIWLFLPRSPHLLPRRLIVFLAAFTFASIMPTSVGLPLQILALVGAFAEWALAPAKERRGGAVVLIAGLFIGFWALLIFHPNIPDASVGMLGFRKTALAVSGVVLGCAIQQRHRCQAERLVIQLLTVALAVSIIGHLWMPAITDLVDRGDADKYTSLYAGEARLEGIFAGPFHAATAGVALVGWAIVRFKSSIWLPRIALIIGMVGTYLTLVRTAYVAVGLSIAVLIILATSLSSFLRRAGVVLAIGALSMWLSSLAGAKVWEVAASITNFATDGRFQNRFPEYETGINMFLASPFIGWGAGSAGDTLAPAIGAGEHVTAHNLLLKIAVEGGLLGLILWAALLVAMWRRIDRRSKEGQMVVVVIAGLFGLGITGSAIEALPVTYLIFMLVGLALSQHRVSGYHSSAPRIQSSQRGPVLNAQPA